MRSDALTHRHSCVSERLFTINTLERILSSLQNVKVDELLLTSSDESDSEDSTFRPAYVAAGEFYLNFRASKCCGSACAAQLLTGKRTAPTRGYTLTSKVMSRGPLAGGSAPDDATRALG